jgi:osmotically-inducible protein OsmY
MRIGLALWLALFGAQAAVPAPAPQQKKEELTDDILYDRVIRRLANDPDLKTTSIEVIVQDRVVTLKGWIDSEKLRQRTEQVTRKTPGVRKVVNEIKVRP